MSDSPFDVVKAQLPIAEAIYYATGQHPEVKPHSGKLRTRCPFGDHEDIHPSFDIDGNRWTCWTHPGGKITGSSVDFVMRWYNEENSAAVKRAYDWLGLTWPENGNGQKKPTHSERNKAKEQTRPPAANKDKVKYSDLKDLPEDEENRQKYERFEKTCSEFYTYYKPSGEPHMRVFRMYTPYGDKFFPQCTWTGSYWSVGCPEDTPRYLYRIEKLQDHDFVFVVEGEKDVHAIEALGYPATTWPGGANALAGQCEKWDILAPLAGKDVVFVCDNDGPGTGAFDGALKYLFGRVDELRRVILPGVDEHGDASDFLELHKDSKDLSDLFLKTCLDFPLYLPDFEATDILYRADMLTKLAPLRPPPEEVVEGIIPVGLTMVGGKKSARKSILCQQIGLAVAKGCKALGYFETKQGTVIHASLEDDDWNWNDRLQKMLTGEFGPETAPNNLYATFLLNPMPDLESQIEQWKNQHPDLNLIFLDILDFILNQTQKAKLRGASSGGYHDWYDILKPLRKLAKRLGIAIVLTHHMNKKESENPFDDFTGSNALGGVTDNMIVIRKVFKKEYQGTLIWQGKRARDTKPKALSFHPDTMTLDVLGDLESITLSQVEQDIIGELESEQKPTKLQNLKSECGETMSPAAFKMVVRRLVEKGRIESCAQKGFYQAKPHTMQ